MSEPLTPERLVEIGANVERFDAALAKSDEANRQLAALMDADPRTPRKLTPEECAADDVAQAAERELSVCWGAVEMSAACRELLAEVERSRAKQKELHGRAQSAEAAMADLLRCNEKFASGAAWCGGSLGRAFLAHANSQLRAEVARLTAERDEAARLLGPFAAWYAAYGPNEIAREAASAYRAAAEFLARLKGEG